jgi:hypothetical protein
LLDTSFLNTAKLILFPDNDHASLSTFKLLTPDTEACPDFDQHAKGRNKNRQESFGSRANSR